MRAHVEKVDILVWNKLDNTDKVEYRCRLVDLHHEEEYSAMERRRIYNHMYSTKYYQG